jgi:hypothetical protein
MPPIGMYFPFIAALGKVPALGSLLELFFFTVILVMIMMIIGSFLNMDLIILLF